MRNDPCIWPLAILGTAALVATGALFTYGNTAGTPSGMAYARLADSFDFPVGKPNAQGYHKARGFTPNGHLGEDWNGDGGGDTDLGDPIYCIGNGIVVLAGDMHMGWGNVVMVRHNFREPAEGGALKTIDSLYGHLDTILVQAGQTLVRGQQLGTMGTAHGLYDAHLHFEVRKNITIGMFRSAFARDFSNYYDPTQFVEGHRVLRGSTGNALMALNTFAPYPGGEAALPPADAAYELGINRSPARVAAAESSRLNKSAFSIKRRGAAAEKPSDAFRADRYSDMRK